MVKALTNLIFHSLLGSLYFTFISCGKAPQKTPHENILRSSQSEQLKSSNIINLQLNQKTLNEAYLSKEGAPLRAYFSGQIWKKQKGIYQKARIPFSMESYFLMPKNQSEQKVSKIIFPIFDFNDFNLYLPKKNSKNNFAIIKNDQTPINLPLLNTMGNEPILNRPFIAKNINSEGIYLMTENNLYFFPYHYESLLSNIAFYDKEASQKGTKYNFMGIKNLSKIEFLNGVILYSENQSFTPPNLNSKEVKLSGYDDIEFSSQSLPLLIKIRTAIFKKYSQGTEILNDSNCNMTKRLFTREENYPQAITKDLIEKFKSNLEIMVNKRNIEFETVFQYINPESMKNEITIRVNQDFLKSIKNAIVTISYRDPTMTPIETLVEYFLPSNTGCQKIREKIELNHNRTQFIGEILLP